MQQIAVAPSGVFDAVVVVIPTVAQRADVLQAMLADWARFGVTPIVQLQPADWPLTGDSQRRNADIAIRRAVEERPDARYVLYCEDDILLGPQLELWMPALMNLHAPVTLFLTSHYYLPPALRHRMEKPWAVPERIVRVRGLRNWWGSQAVLMPRDFVDDLLRWESSYACWDIHFKEFLVRHGIPMYAPIPNPVQHRDIVTSIPTNVAIPRSPTYGRPSDGGGISPPPEPGWCPIGDWVPDPRVQ
jgi:hypothetical protein